MDNEGTLIRKVYSLSDTYKNSSQPSRDNATSVPSATPLLLTSQISFFEWPIRLGQQTVAFLLQNYYPFCNSYNMSFNNWRISRLIEEFSHFLITIHQMEPIWTFSVLSHAWPRMILIFIQSFIIWSHPRTWNETLIEICYKILIVQ